MRTQEQIIADCEKRFEELRAERDRRDADRRVTHPCETCRWAKGEFWPEYCAEPLVKGFGKPVALRLYMATVADWARQWKDDKGRAFTFPALCGPEKALWQPKLTLCQRIINWLTED